MSSHSTDATAPRGQVLVITAFALIVLLGIAALVVDLGFSWMLRRQEQNAADPAAIAAARYLKDDLGNASWNPAAAEADACFYAQENGFFTDDPGCTDALDVSGDLQVHSPPLSGPYAGIGGHVQVIIRSTHPSFFARVFGRDDATVVSSAVAANTTGNSNSSSLVALQTDCSAGSAGDVDGGGEVSIFAVNPGDVGGYVHVNSPCGTSVDDICDNGVGQAALSISGTLRAPVVNTTGTCTEQGTSPGLICTPAPTPPATTCVDEGASPLGDPLFDLPEPHLDAFPNGVCPDGSASTPASTSPCRLRGTGPTACPTVDGIPTCTLVPGVYYGGFDIRGVRVQLQPGMYILAGGGIQLSGPTPSLESVESPSGVEARVTIFSTDGPGCPSIPAQCQGAITFTANESFRAKALNTATCGLVSPQACPWRGILLWQDATASNGDATVMLGGQASSILAGTIYAPAAEVQIAGGTDTTGCSGPAEDQSCLSIQIISWRWKISGNGLVEMPYDPAELYQPENRGLVH
jgi:hypothetical protein